MFTREGSKYCNSFPLVRGWGHGAKKISRFVLVFADVIEIFIFLEKIKLRWSLEDFGLSFSEQVLLLQ